MTRTVLVSSVISFLVLAACTRQDPARVSTDSPAHNRNAEPNDEWTRADFETVRLSPDRFTRLPSAIAVKLRDLGCTVPQIGTSEPHNVVTGRFISAGNADWAVLCSRNRASSILVFVNGSSESMMELEPSPDRQWLQGGAGGSIEFSRAIAVASPRYIVEHHEAFGGPELPPLDHDGINDIFIEKGSVVLYWHGGQWHHLQGAD